MEDTEINQRVARGLLELDGHQVDSTPDGYSALAMHDSSHHDLVLMDIHLPDMDGMETTRRMRQHANPQKANIPIVALTASMTAAEIDQYHAAGIDTVLGKPLLLEPLRQLLLRLPLSPAGLSPANLAQTAPSHPGWLDAASEQAAPISTARSSVVANAVTNPPTPVDALLDSLLDQTLLQQHKDALGEDKFSDLLGFLFRQCDALFADLATALVEQNTSAVVDSAHKLAGASANFGLTALSSACRGIEQQSDQNADPALADRIKAANQLYRQSQQLLAPVINPNKELTSASTSR
ncbi:MAG: response regulator [Motiliproteus sp.]